MNKKKLIISKNITLRPANDSDIKLMFRLQHYNGEILDFNNPQINPQLKKYKENFIPGKIQVILYKNIAIGRLRVICQKEIYIGGIQILPDFRGKKIGTEIILNLQEESNKNKIPILLEVFHNNPEAFNFYKKLNFKVISQNKKQKIMKFCP